MSDFGDEEYKRMVCVEVHSDSDSDSDSESDSEGDGAWL
jgi:D-hexose-6-phosphate mutarotase